MESSIIHSTRRYVSEISLIRYPNLFYFWYSTTSVYKHRTGALSMQYSIFPGSIPGGFGERIVHVVDFTGSLRQRRFFERLLIYDRGCFS